MTKKQFVEDVVAQLDANPRKVLAGHGISGAMLQKIGKRPDVMKYLALSLYPLKTAKKGAVGLKKTNLFQIKAYKNFAELNTKARLDVEKFMSGLKGKDASDFNNADNIVTVVFDNASKFVQGPEGDDVIEEMANPSVLLKFDSAVRKEYKLPGVSYVVIMTAPSAIRPAEEKLAMRKEKINKRKNDREDKVAKVRARLKKKARKALARNKAELAGLKNRAFGLEMQNAQYDYLTKKTGAQDLWTGIQNMNTKSAQLAVKKLNSADAKLFVLANKFKEQGDEDSARAILSKIKNKRQLAALVNGNAPAAGNEMIDKRRRELARTIKSVEKKLEQLQIDLALAPMQKRTSVKSMISKYSAQLKQLKARMNFYSKKNTTAMSSKAQQLAQVRAAIEANIEEGNTISSSLNAALAELEASAKQKRQIKQQIVQQVADGMPMQFAVQQAIQDNIVNEVVDVEDELLDDDIENGTISFSDLMNML